MLFEAPMRDMQIYIGLQALYQLALSIARRCAALPPAAFCGDWTLNLHFEAAVLRVFLKPRGVRLNLGTRVQNSIYKIALILIIYIYIYISNCLRPSRFCAASEPKSERRAKKKQATEMFDMHCCDLDTFGVGGTPSTTLNLNPLNSAHPCPFHSPWRL